MAGRLTVASLSLSRVQAGQRLQRRDEEVRRGSARRLEEGVVRP